MSEQLTTTTTTTMDNPVDMVSTSNGNYDNDNAIPTSPPTQSTRAFKHPLLPSQSPNKARAKKSTGTSTATSTSNQKSKPLPEERDPTRQGKNKDLSHVPCRFFRMGACAAGDGCVFSHDLGETATVTKQVCQWFLKGNCRFGHKCALAHVYPNEPPTMDRKHKKAAQLAANGVPQEEIDSVVFGGTSYILPAGGYSGEGDEEATEAVAIPGATSRTESTAAEQGGKMSYSQTLKSPPKGKVGESLMEAATSTKRRDSSSEATRPGAVAIKSATRNIAREGGIPIGSISPANRHQAALLSTLNRPNSAGIASSSPTPTTATFAASNSYVASSSPSTQTMPRGPGDVSENFKSRPMPLSVPGPLPMSARSGSFHQDPIGTPPREATSFTLGRSIGPGSSVYSASKTNGSYHPATAMGTMSESTRPGVKTTGFSDPTLSAPQTARYSSSVVGGEFGQMGRDIWGQRTSFGPATMNRTNSTQNPARPQLDPGDRRESEVFLLDEDDEEAGEELLPGSLTDLLTPRERARRLSRRESGSGPSVASGAVGIRTGWVSSSGSGENTSLAGLGSAGSSWDSRPNMDALLHRQAMSAGAVDGGFLRSLWDDAGEDVRRKRMDQGPVSASGLSSMFATHNNHSTNTHIHSNGEGNLTAPPDSNFQLGPSNASVAFLPTFTHRQSLLVVDHGSPVSRGMLHSPSRPSPLHRDSTQLDTQIHLAPPSQIGSGVSGGSSNVPVQDGLEVNPPKSHLNHPHGVAQRPVVSPGTRALEAHAPGQSLPQGLAAGLSRLHLRPATRSSHPQQTNAVVESSHHSNSNANANLGITMGRYESLARPSLNQQGEGEDDDLFEMEG